MLAFEIILWNGHLVQWLRRLHPIVEFPVCDLDLPPIQRPINVYFSRLEVMTHVVG